MKKTLANQQVFLDIAQKQVSMSEKAPKEPLFAHIYINEFFSKPLFIVYNLLIISEKYLLVEKHQQRQEKSISQDKILICK